MKELQALRAINLDNSSAVKLRGISGVLQEDMYYSVTCYTWSVYN